MLTPGQIAQTLDVSTATVRRWSARYAHHLSPNTPGKKRSYTVDDLAVLTRVRDLSATGTPLVQIDQALAVTVTPAQSSALIALSDFALSLQSARDQVAHLQLQLDQQNTRLDALTAWLALPFYKRWFAKPPRL
jgi:MerR family transcriptional regulator, light-induced transcriptional regulator